jgi:homoserine kinase
VVFLRLVAAAGVGTAAFFSVAVASAAPSDDQAFIAALDRQKITYPSPQFAVSVAKEVCTLLDDGAVGVDVAREINKTSGIPVGSSGAFVGASIVAYCPSHTDAFSS